MGTIMLTNISTSVFTTTKGKFHPGTSKEFVEKEGLQLLGYRGAIVRTEDAIGSKDLKKIVKAKDEEIKALKKKIKGLEAPLKARR